MAEPTYGFGFKRASVTAASIAAPQPAVLDNKKPKPLEGWLEKKGNGKVHMGGEWQKRYVRVDEASSSLTYAKTSSPSEKPAGSIDLKVVGDILPHSGKKGQQDYSRFDVDDGDGRTFKFRAANEGEGRRWVDGLNEWRDYFLLNM